MTTKAEWDAMDAGEKDELVYRSVLKTGGPFPPGAIFTQSPTTDRNACALVLKKIEREGRVFQFMEALIELHPSAQHSFAMGTKDRKELLWGYWILFNADPDLVCYCAVKAVDDV